MQICRTFMIISRTEDGASRQTQLLKLIFANSSLVLSGYQCLSGDRLSCGLISPSSFLGGVGAVLQKRRCGGLMEEGDCGEVRLTQTG